ncbi:cytochrome c3 family protein [Truepera radiovictrix]|uniref:CRIB domain-containing protein n=1 Tax=Truepera radiovictrix (strain DSM 17093 / CIP 108686 / LMG 22925 / RQ-24) TaxID=649638 RepID=D7CVC6_TRURR|nr:cytochrome c3 family protein [Truepera radiovictrix]ADI14154.1 conserved hypothetical protein [Truepera radiovictrix DSM 17093]WMT57284.1 cytochrome c3 family protein [Truepera radiovictrix]
MPQILPPNANTFARWTIIGGVIFVILLVISLTAFARISRNRVGVPVAQPVGFQHSLHAGELGIDCRYCHNVVEVSAYSHVPPTEVCMTCHSQIRVGTPQLAAVYESWETGTPIAWNRVHKLADFVYFNHSAHINSGIGCNHCHGRVDQMSAIWKAEPMTMGWCLECHRNPARYVRPREEVFNLAYEYPANQLEIGAQLVEAYNINADALANCSICHR